MSMETEKMETPEDVREIVYKAAVALRLGAYGMGGEPNASDLSAAEDILKAVWDDVVDWERRRLEDVARVQRSLVGRRGSLKDELRPGIIRELIAKFEGLKAEAEEEYLENDCSESMHEMEACDYAVGVLRGKL